MTLCIVFVTLTREDLKRPPKFLLQMNILKIKVSKNNVEKPLLNMHWVLICFSSGRTELKTYHLKKKITCGIKWRLMFVCFLLFFIFVCLFVLFYCLQTLSDKRNCQNKETKIARFSFNFISHVLAKSAWLFMGVFPPEPTRFLVRYEKVLTAFFWSILFLPSRFINYSKISRPKTSPVLTNSIDPTAHITLHWMGHSPSWLRLLMNWNIQ